MIQVKDLVKSYDGHLAVDHLSFSIEQGKVLGFLGPNGAGKSTVMNIITGYISATEGTVTVDGHDIFEEPEAAKKAIGYLPEIPPVYPDMTVNEYLRFVAELKGVRHADIANQIKDVENLTKTRDVDGRLIKHLSKGYRQRVGLAQALIGNPKALILDEPTVGLDPQQIIEMRQLIKNLNKDHTIMISSHILSEISAICDEVVIINKGRLVVEDSPENLAQRMEKQEMVHLTVKGLASKAESTIAEVEKVESVEIENEKDGFTNLTAYCGINDAREDIFYACANAGLPIFDMHVSTRSLEDIFIELTGKDSNKKKRRIVRRGEDIAKAAADAENQAADETAPESGDAAGEAVFGKEEE